MIRSLASPAQLLYSASPVSLEICLPLLATPRQSRWGRRGPGSLAGAGWWWEPPGVRVGEFRVVPGSRLSCGDL